MKRQHGLHGIKQRQPRSKVAKRARKARLRARKQDLLQAIQTAVQEQPEVS